MGIDIEKEIINSEELIENVMSKHMHGLDTEWVDQGMLVKKIFDTTPDKIMYYDLLTYMADYIGGFCSIHEDYNKLATRIALEKLYDLTNASFGESTKKLYNSYDKDGSHYPIIKKEYYEAVINNIEAIEKEIKMERDNGFDFFGIRTFERSYLLKDRKGIIVERPQYLFMRVSIAVHLIKGKLNLEKAFETYKYMSKKYFIHATPTLFNAGCVCEQLASCFLLTIGDNIEDIFDKIKSMALISKYAGGLGVNVSNIRAEGSAIRGTNGKTSSIIVLCRHLNTLCAYINQSSRRAGSAAIYVEPWHADIYDFVALRNPQTQDDLCARDLFLGLWVCDLFMEQVKKDGDWYLMCPSECPGLPEVYGEKFEELYWSYVKAGKYRKK